ncbi:hypothetical protein UFOVP257_366 [uncultured Caudovirales phage]|uniref:Uncharacterized protein n=1 Tax=uncultured Caudovirales phage TaxID=2100421 RepID=A0A6J5LGD0_9CAUD|nr:hypothetical protein UFOVP257_366 [uncultured Caudovirales phage]
MIKNYRGYAYFDNNPEIVKIFDDLEAFRNFCRMEMAPFNEGDLYNRSSWVWRNYEKSLRPKSDSGDRSERKPYQGKNPRYSR